MTACVNKNHGRRVAGVVTASLVGALTLGGVSLAAVPTVALAEQGSLQANTGAQALAYAKVTKAITTNNRPVEIEDNGATVSVTASSEGLRGVYPTELQIANTTVTVSDQDFESGKWGVEFYAAGSLKHEADGKVVWANGTKPAQVVPYAVGDYQALVYCTDPDSPYYNEQFGENQAWAGALFTFRIKPAEIGKITVTDTTGNDFVYDGEPQFWDKDTHAFTNAQVLVDGKKVDLSKFDVALYKKGDSETVQTFRDATNAGDYVVKLTGKSGTIYAGKSGYGEFTVQKLDLSKADVVINDMTIASLKALGNPADVNGKATVTSQLKSAFKSSTTNTVDQPGEYTFTVSAKDASNPNVTGSKDVTFATVEKMLSGSDFFYDKDGLKGQYSYDLRKDGSFNADLVNVKGPDGKALDKAGFTVSVTDADGNAATTADLAKPGKWYVTVSVNAKYYGYELGGKATTVVKNVAGVVENAGVFFSYDNKISTFVTDTYDGSDLLSKLKVAVYDNLGNELKQGDDYKVIVTDADGNEVDKVIDAGTYKVKVTSDSWDIQGTQEFTLTVSPIQVSEVRVSNLTTLKKADGSSVDLYPYTGSDITPALQYKDVDGKWVDLPADTYELVYQYSATNGKDSKFEVVDSINKVGYYKVFAHQAEGVKNYQIANTATKGFVEADNSPVWVSNAKLFSDVANDQWYSKAVNKAVTLGYMSGYAGTDLFGPEDPVTRGQVAVVLFNMAGGKPVYDEEWFDKNVGAKTPFSDVDSNQYYAPAISWAAKAGVVHGDAGSTTFRPDDRVSREELAAMLYNYAKLTGKAADGTVDVDSILSKFDDGSKVSPWMEKAVAWAASAKVMGNGGYLAPTDNVKRDETAAMAVNFQPNGKFESPLDLSK